CACLADFWTCRSRTARPNICRRQSCSPADSMTKHRRCAWRWLTNTRPTGTRCIRRLIGLNSSRLKGSGPIVRFLSPALALGLILFAIIACRSTRTPAPSWTKAKILSDKEDHPSKIVSDGAAVYFVTGGTVASMNEGTNNIKRISLSDGAVTILVKGGKQIPEAMLA